MEQEWLLHDSRNSFFRSPCGAVFCGTRIEIKLQIHSGNTPDWVVLHLWQQGQEENLPMSLSQGDGTPRVYRVEIATPAVPGLLWYYFALGLEGKTYYYGNNKELFGGVGQVWEQSPAAYQITVCRQGVTTPNWFKEAVMYQIFVDRFNNGHPDRRIENIPAGSMIHAYWDDTPFYVRDMRSGAIFSYDFFGGNIPGVMDKLEFLQDLGISAIYLNPVFESPSNHKYDTGDYKKIDPMFGDNELFRGFCAKSSELGINIILDGVFSHTGSDSRYFNREGRYSDLGAYQSPDSPYFRWYRFSEYPRSYESWWGIDTLPNVNELEPSYVNFIIDGDDSVVKFWQKAGIKGWRLDVADELPDEFIKHLRTVLKEQDPESVLIGEVWEDASRKESYGKTREYLLGDELDAVTNYPFRSILLDFVLYRKNAAETQQALCSLWENYPAENFYATMNLLGGHDLPRVLTLLGDAPLPDSMSIIEQARYRLPPEKRQLAIARLKMLVLWQMTFPGVPCIYYGDEAGMEGYTDPFNRGTYPWGREERELLDWYKLMTSLRNRLAVLRTGQWIALEVSGDVYGYIRRISGGRDVFGQPRKNNTAVLLFNRDSVESRTFSADIGQYCQGELIDIINNKKSVRLADGRLEITLGPLEGKLLLEREEQEPAFERSSGILLHPTSLPSRYGCGDFGPEAKNFVEFLARGGQKFWQILPLNPPGFGESPYASVSAFAGNSLLISPEGLLDEGLLIPENLAHPPPFDQDQVEFAAVAQYKDELFRQAFEKFHALSKDPGYEAFIGENTAWLKNYAMFMALKSHFGGQSWIYWDKDVAARDEQALAKYENLLAKDIKYHYFLQYMFFKQWRSLKEHVRSKGIRIIGDLPLFVAHDSSDVWANQHLFRLDEHGMPEAVAGVPPDYFSSTGQLWGNPQYDWQAMHQDSYRWWRERFRLLLKQVDIVRIDHFRGFEAYWEVPGEEKTAVNGKWVKGPGKAFFTAMDRYLGHLPVIAENLGVITPQVEQLREKFNFPGMKVLQFCFSADWYGKCSADDCEDNMVVYTGTHDNNTSLGWYESLAGDYDLSASIRKYLDLPQGASPGEFCRRFIERAYANQACIAIIPLQDLLSLGDKARMNLPGTVGGNWNWRYRDWALTSELADNLAGLTAQYQR